MDRDTTILLRDIWTLIADILLRDIDPRPHSRLRCTCKMMHALPQYAKANDAHLVVAVGYQVLPYMCKEPASTWHKLVRIGMGSYVLVRQDTLCAMFVYLGLIQYMGAYTVCGLLGWIQYQSSVDNNYMPVHIRVGCTAQCPILAIEPDYRIARPSFYSIVLQLRGGKWYHSSTDSGDVGAAEQYRNVARVVDSIVPGLLARLLG